MQNAIENDKGKQPLQRKRDKRQKVSTTAETLQNNRTHTHWNGENGESIAQRIEERKVPIVAADAVALILRRRQNSNKQQQMQTASKPLTEKPPLIPPPNYNTHSTTQAPIHPLNPTKHKQTRENRAKQCN